MRAFLWPHRLMAPVAVYTAALHHDDKTARAAFERWAETLVLDQISYHQHKPIGLIAGRFAADLDRFQHGGVLRNIARQGRLRTHAQMALLDRLLHADGVEAVQLIAIGALRERLLAAPAVASDLDLLELCMPLSDWRTGLARLAAAGWHARTAPVRARGRQALITQICHDSCASPVRVLGLPITQAALVWRPESGGLGLMSASAHQAFMRSRAASLLVRRDQALFDIFHTRHAAPDAGLGPAMAVSDLPWPFRRKAARVLGRAAGS